MGAMLKFCPYLIMVSIPPDKAFFFFFFFFFFCFFCFFCCFYFFFQLQYLNMFSYFSLKTYVVGTHLERIANVLVEK